MNLIITLILAIILLETSILLFLKLRQTDFGGNQKRKIYVDTSVLMDGRILAIAESGFLDGHLIIPQSVLHELQLLADGKDSDKRTRARYGLDVAHSLESIDYPKTSILYDELDYTPVDNRLLELAKANRGYLITNDFNLNKVATAEGIPVLNINDLVMVLRGEYLPGEHALVKISAAGSNAHQGIGYLLDGTMTVVENASNCIGQEVEVEFVRFIQTSAGKMVFGKIVEKAPVKNHREVKRVNGRSMIYRSSTETSERDKPVKMPRNSSEAENELIKLLAESESDLAILESQSEKAVSRKASPSKARSRTNKNLKNNRQVQSKHVTSRSRSKK